MHIRILANTNIRSDPRDLRIPPIGIIFSGVEIEVEDRLYRGAPFENIDTYFRDARGWYYWSGRIAIIYKELPAPRREEISSEPVGGSWKIQVEDAGEKEPSQPEEPIEEAPFTEPEIIHGGPAKTKEEKDDSFSEVVEQEENQLTPPTSPGEPEEEGYTQGHPLLSKTQQALQIPQLYWEQQKALGQGIKIAFLDGQVDLHHPDLRAAVFEDAGYGSQVHIEEGNIRSDAGADLRAGLIAGRGTQSLLGVAPRASLLIANIFFNSYEINFDRFLASLDWSMRQGADLVFTCADLREERLSNQQRKQLGEMVGKLRRKGILLIAPVGNGQIREPENRYPACLPDSLSVGSLNGAERRAPYSLRSNTLDILAPGEHLFPAGRSPKIKSTADSAALVTGVLALLLEIGRRKKKTLDATRLKAILRATAVPKFPTNKCRDLDYGCGILDVKGALKKLTGRPMESL